MGLARDVIDREGDTFELYATRRLNFLIRDTQGILNSCGFILWDMEESKSLPCADERMNPQLFNIPCVSRIKKFRRTMDCASTGPPSVR
jgi:hypothetical protein